MIRDTDHDYDKTIVFCVEEKMYDMISYYPLNRACKGLVMLADVLCCKEAHQMIATGPRMVLGG